MWVLKYLRFVAGHGPAPPGSELQSDAQAAATAAARRAVGGMRSRILGSARIEPALPSPAAARDRQGLTVEIPTRRRSGISATELRSPRTPALPLSPASPSKLSQERAVLSWMAACGVPIADATGDVPEGGLAGAIKDGTVLCRLVSGLEQVKLRGIHWRPSKHATMLHNVEKALEVLRSR